MTSNNVPSLGRNMRRLRKERGWSMMKMGDVTGMTQSSLSKIENGQMSLSYEKLVEAARRLDVPIMEFFALDDPEGQRIAASARLAVDRGSEKTLVNWKNVHHRQLAREVKDRLMIATYGEITGTDSPVELELGGYDGERFCYVIEGTIEFHSEHYETYTLKKGDSLYLDIRMRHAVVCAKGKSAKCIFVTTSQDDRFLQMERALAGYNIGNLAEFEQFQRPRAKQPQARAAQSKKASAKRSKSKNA